MDNSNQVTPAKTEFKKNGYLYKQMARSGLVAVYGQYRLPDDGAGAVAYEVVIFTIRKANPDFNRLQPFEQYPGSEDWGSKGWTYHDAQVAAAKYEILIGSMEVKDRIT